MHNFGPQQDSSLCLISYDLSRISSLMIKASLMCISCAPRYLLLHISISPYLHLSISRSRVIITKMPNSYKKDVRSLVDNHSILSSPNMLLRPPNPFLNFSLINLSINLLPIVITRNIIIDVFLHVSLTTMPTHTH